MKKSSKKLVIKESEWGMFIEYLRNEDAPLYAILSSASTIEFLHEKVVLYFQSPFIAEQACKCVHELKGKSLSFFHHKLEFDFIEASNEINNAKPSKQESATEQQTGKLKMADNIKPIISSLITSYCDLSAIIFVRKLKESFLKFNIESPIEQVLYSALIHNMLSVSDPETFHIVPQYKHDQYRADFLIYSDGSNKRLIVECDSQEFHDRSEDDRRYEKERDRKFQKDGFSVFRYTGKDILQNHLSIATEIIDYLCGSSVN